MEGAALLTQLLVNVFTVGPLNAGDSVTVPHGLMSRGEPVVPTLIQPDRATPIVVEEATDLAVRFTNYGTATATAVFRFERGLSNEVDADTLTPSYWQGVVAGGGGGGVSAVVGTAPIAATGFPVTDVSLLKSGNFVTNGGGQLDLSDTGVTAASYGNLAAANQSIVPTFTVDAKGRLTAAGSGAIKVGGFDAKTYIDNQDNDILAQANAFAEGLAFGIASKEPAHVATDVALPANTQVGLTLVASANGPFPTVDGETITVPQRVLVKNEAAQSKNGIYFLSDAGSAGTPWVLTRTADANTAGELCGSIIPVETGTQSGTVWLFAANSTTFIEWTTPVVWVELTVGAATAGTLGIVQLAGGLGGGGPASAPKLNVDAANVGGGTLPAIRGGTGQAGTLVADAGKVLTADGSGGWTVSAVPATSTTIAQTYYVTMLGNDGTGDGSIAKPLATIGEALTRASLAYPSGEYVQINVAPGTYVAPAVDITRLNTFIVGSGPRPEDWGTRITGTMRFNPTFVGSRFVNQIAVSGCFIQSTTNAPAVEVAGTGAFTLTVTNSYLTTNNSGASASAFSCSNANAKVVVQDCSLTTQAATSASVVAVTAGDVKVQACQVQNAAGSTSKPVGLSGSGYLFCDSVLLENAAAVATVDVAGTTSAGYKLLLSNCSVTALLGSGVTVNAVGTTSFVTNTVFTVLAASDIITATAGAVIYGNLTSTPTYSVAISGAGAVPYNETHGEVILPALTASRPLKLNASKKVVADLIDLASASDVTGTLPATNGGTAQNTYAKGDLLYASAVNTLSRLPLAPTDGLALTVDSALGVPVWRAIPATTLQGAYNAGKNIVLSGGVSGLLNISYDPLNEAAFSIRGGLTSSISGPDLAVGGSGDNTSIFGALQLATTENILSNGGIQPLVALPEGTIVFRNSSDELAEAVATSSARILGVVGAGAAGTNGYVQSIAGTLIGVRYIGTPAVGADMYLSATAGVAQAGPPSSGLPYYLGTFRYDDSGLAYIDWNPLPPVPYDLAGSVAGEPPALAKCFYFVATRRCVITATGHRAGANTVPSANTTFTVYAGAVNIGTFTVPVGGSVSFSLTETVVNAGTVVSVEAPALLNGLADLYFTFSAVTNA